MIADTGKKTTITMRVSARALPLIAALTSLSASLAIGGCAVGPDFKKPAAPNVSEYTAQPLSTTAVSPGVEGGQAQSFAKGADLSGDWWTLFHSQALNDLVEQSLKNNSDLKAAQATLRQAHENALAQTGAFYPQLSAAASASHQQEPYTLAPVPNSNAFQFSLFTPQLNVSFVPDVFGLTRRTVESYEAQADSIRYQMLATYITLVNNVVAVAVQEASTHAQIDATHRLIEAETKSVHILEYQQAKGYASGVDLAAQQSQLAAAEATLPPLIKQEAQFHDQLAVLTGQFPAQAQGQEKLALSDLTLPTDLPVSLPSNLVNQRPDVLQAEANLHAASAQIGIAVANRLPNFQLTATAGSTALAFTQIFGTGTEFWSAGAALAAPIFDGGTLLHQERAARAAYDASAAQYRSTVLTAFQNVADTLTALQQDAAGLKAASAADAAARRTLELTQRQLQDEYTGYLGLLSAQQAYQQAEIGLIQAEVNRYADTAALFQALGGGWWHRPDLNGEK
jgi:NodT family efflux transporter outer membrane factor (OMF) lipoprotein